MQGALSVSRLNWKETRERVPLTDLITTEHSRNATPEIIRVYKLDDEQEPFSQRKDVRYNRLIDTFLGLTTYSLLEETIFDARAVPQMA